MNKEDITFKDFNLSKDTFGSISQKGFKNPTEIQAKVIPLVFERAHDIVAIAQTGTGKTGAFGLPLVDIIDENNKTPKALILAPTRELAIQVTKELESYTTKKKLKILSVYGGASISNQIKDLRKGTDIIVGTPGRIVDMVKREELKLSEVENFVLDEADEMLNMGFIEDIEFILSKTNNKKRVYLFSATMPKRIQQLSKRYMKKQVIVEVEHDHKAHTELIDQSFFRLKRSQKSEALMKVVDVSDFFYGIVFCKTKSDVDELTRELKRNRYEADCIHGDIDQKKREKILQRFRDMKINILVATDVAARGIDVNNLTHVINHSLPQAIETYVHRIGRTGRAGNKGKAITFLTDSEMRKLTNLEKETGFRLRKENLPSDKDVQKKTKNKTIAKYGEIISKKDHTNYLDMAKDLMKEHDAKELIAAMLYKENYKEVDKSEPKEGRRENNRSYGRNRGNNRNSKGRNFAKEGRDRSKSTNRDRNYSKGNKNRR